MQNNNFDKEVRNKQAYTGAFSRGRLARIRGDSKDENPYTETSGYRDIWLDGWEAANDELKRNI